MCEHGGHGPAWHVSSHGCGHCFGSDLGFAHVWPHECGGTPDIGRGSKSLPHQHAYSEGNASLGKLQPGQRHCRGAGSSPSTGPVGASVLPSFFDHFLIQPRWKTVQHSVHDHTLDFVQISLVQMEHSYRPCAMSSCVRVAMSGAVERSNESSRARGSSSVLCVLRRGPAVLPGTNSGASPCRPVSVKCPLNACPAAPRRGAPAVPRLAEPAAPPRDAPRPRT